MLRFKNNEMRLLRKKSKTIRSNTLGRNMGLATKERDNQEPGFQPQDWSTTDQARTQCRNDRDLQEPQMKNECGQCGKEYEVPEDGYTLGYCQEVSRPQSWEETKPE